MCKMNGLDDRSICEVGQCKLTVSKPVLKLESTYGCRARSYNAFKLCFQIQLAPLQRGAVPRVGGRGLHSSTFRLNLSALYGIGDARRGCVACFKGVFRVCRVFSCVRQGSS